MGQRCVFANLLKRNSYKPCFFFTTSIGQSEKQEILTSITQLSQSLSIDIIMGFSDSPALDNLSEEEKVFVDNHLRIHKSNSGQIERSTVSQAATPKWFEERKKRLTASNFGSVLNRRKNIYPASLLQKVFGCLTFYSEACQWGKTNEVIAIKKYEEIKSVTVSKCVLIVNPKWPWLGTSPDGIINQKGKLKAVEVKCPFSKKELTILEACIDKNFCMKLFNGVPKLKEGHPYYYQCQGVMALTELDEIDFIVYTNRMFHRDNKFPAERMGRHNFTMFDKI